MVCNNATYGNDNIWAYGGGFGTKTDSTYGLYTISNSNDAPEYSQVMNALYEAICAKYSNISSDIILSTFKEAQKEAIKIAQENIYDCPFGTGNNGQFSDYNDNFSIDNAPKYESTNDWVNQRLKNSGFFRGRNNRNKDDSDITVQELVQLTLYCFDKLLYKNIAA